MKILYVVPYVPNLIRVRPYNLIRFLSTRGHEVTVATLWSSPGEYQDARVLEAQCHKVEALQISRWRSLVNCIAALPTSTPLQAVYSWQPAFAQKLDELARMDFDIVHIEHLRGVKYGLYLRHKHPKLPIVWDSVDCISLLFRWAAQRSGNLLKRWLTRFEVGRTQKYEGKLIAPFEQVLVTSPIDQKALAELAPPTSSTKITVLTNGVDLDYFQPGTETQRAPATLVVSGKMSYHANITMVLYLVKEIMPHVWASRPDAQLQIVGKNPSKEIQALGEKTEVQVIGSVPDLRPYLQKASAALTPILYGVGIQNKVLEAMACATPVVSTPQAVSALQVQIGKDILVEQDPQAFAKAILSLLNNPNAQQEIGQAGRAYVEKHHQWPHIASDLENIYQEIRHTQGLL